eukprot:scaffold189043_cov40-Prasinocladus_malaysianus.AAC.1
MDQHPYEYTSCASERWRESTRTRTCPTRTRIVHVQKSNTNKYMSYFEIVLDFCGSTLTRSIHPSQWLVLHSAYLHCERHQGYNLSTIISDDGR